jgi:GNAT superfamily N-acetyltransferase
MDIRISMAEPESTAVSTFLMIVRGFAPVTYEMLFSDYTWRAVGEVAIAYDVHERYAVGVAGLVRPDTVRSLKWRGSVAAIWVTPEMRRNGIGLALLQELSRLCAGNPLEMSILSQQAALLYEKAKSCGIELWHKHKSPAGAYSLFTMS